MNDKPSSPLHDPVSHPSHYTSDPSGIECITITRHRNFNIGNAIKYLWRAGLKSSDTTIQDLKKAIWYIQDEIKRLENFSQIVKQSAEPSNDRCSMCGASGTLLYFFYSSAAEKAVLVCGSCHNKCHSAKP